MKGLNCCLSCLTWIMWLSIWISLAAMMNFMKIQYALWNNLFEVARKVVTQDSNDKLKFRFSVDQADPMTVLHFYFANFLFIWSFWWMNCLVDFDLAIPFPLQENCQEVIILEWCKFNFLMLIFYELVGRRVNFPSICCLLARVCCQFLKFQSFC